MKNAADEKGIIANVSTEQKRLVGRDALQRNQHVGDVLLDRIGGRVRRAQTTRARKCFQERTHVIAKFAIADSGLL